MPSTRIKEASFFLVKELQVQIQTLASRDSSRVVSSDVSARHDYVSNLVASVQNRCIEALSTNTQEHEQLIFRCYYNLAASLGEISFACTHCSNQINQDIQEAFDELIHSPPMKKLFKRAAQAFYVIEEVISEDAEAGAGHRLCEIAQNLNEKNGKILKQLSKLTDDKFHDAPKVLLLMTGVLFRFYMDLCNGIMKLGEIVLSLEHNDILSLRQYRSLQQSLSSINLGNSTPEAVLQRLAETKSGCVISGVQIEDQEAFVGVLKEGPIHKLRPEREKMLFWEEHFQGYVPEILTYDEHDDTAALLIEFVDGRTFDQTLIHGGDKKFERSSQLFLETVGNLWRQTLRRDLPAQATFTNQLASRLDKVYLIHKEFSLRLPQKRLLERIQACRQIEETLVPNFSVLSHGDFNVDNLLFTKDLTSLKFIDLHRSQYGDYLQDASVFLLSNLRFLAKSPDALERVDVILPKMLRLIREFADQHQDYFVEARLALGLARSFISSTRFIYDDEFADKLFCRGIGLLDELLNHTQDMLATYRLSESILFGKSLCPPQTNN